MRCGVGAALLAACLQAGAASALSFNFSFTGTGNPISPATLTGIVDGLVDNLNDQKYGLSITIASATNKLPGGWAVLNNFVLGERFDVSGGQVTGVNIYLVENNEFQELYPGNQDDNNLILVDSLSQIFNTDLNSTMANSLVFTPASSPKAPVSHPPTHLRSRCGFRLESSAAAREQDFGLSEAA